MKLRNTNMLKLLRSAYFYSVAYIFLFVYIIFMIWHILYSLYMAFIDFQHRLCGRAATATEMRVFYHQYSGGDGCRLPRVSPTNHTPHVPFMCHPERSQPRFTSPALGPNKHPRSMDKQ